MRYLTILLICFLPFAGFSQKEKKAKKEKKSKQVSKVGKTYTTETGLKYTILKEGEGARAKAGDKVKVHYTGRLTNDTVFDSSVARNQPFEFELGAGRVIKGWDEGVALMNVGDKMTFVIPADLGYGSQAVGKIPANSTLIFDVELLAIKEPIKKTDVSGKDTIVTESGLKYVKITENKSGRQVQKGDKVKVHYSGFLVDGKMFDSSVERGQPFDLMIGKGMVIKGWDEGLTYFREGEKGQLIIKPELGYGERGYPPVIPANSTLIFDVEIVKAEKGPEPPKPFDVSGKDTITLPSGLKYIKLNETTGAQAMAGQNVSVHYSGYLENGDMFDSSVERDQPFSFPLGQGRVIKGWDEGIAQLKVGEKARLIIPSELGYGATGAGGRIPPNATLVFDVELMGVN